MCPTNNPERVPEMPTSSPDSSRASDFEISGAFEADGGKPAWIFLAAVSVMLQLTWGFVISFGAFREYYFNSSIFAGNQSIVVIGAASLGVIQTMCPFLVHFLSGRPQLRKPLLYIGTAIVVLASIGAGFSHTPLQLIMTQGVLYGIGSGMIFAPNMSLIDEWFIKRRSLAYGIYFASSSLSAAIISPVLRGILQTYSAKVTLVGWGIFVGVCLNVVLLGVRPRLPHSSSSCMGSTKKLDPISSKISYRFIGKPLFWLIMFSNITQALSQYLPPAYIPSYAVDVIGTPPRTAAALLTVHNVSSAVFQPAIGIFADRKGILWPLIACTMIPTFAVFGVWGFAKSYKFVALVNLLFGGFSGGYVVLRSRFATAVVGDGEHPNQELLVSGMIVFIRGFATIVTGCMGAAIVSIGADKPLERGAYGAGRWLPLIIFAGTLSAASVLGVFGFIGRYEDRGTYRLIPAEDSSPTDDSCSPIEASR